MQHLKYLKNACHEHKVMDLLPLIGDSMYLPLGEESSVGLLLLIRHGNLI